MHHLNAPFRRLSILNAHSISRFFLIFLLVFFSGISGVRAQNSGSFEKVEVKGNSRIESDAILEKMALKPGDALESSAVAADIRSIFSLGYFEDVRFSLDSDGGVSTLVVEVKERPVVTKITYVGAEEFDAGELEETTGLKPFHVLSVERVRSAEEKIAQKYEEKGYYIARASTEVWPVPGRPSEVELRIKVEENDKVVIRKIQFLGNEKFAASELKRIMITSEGHVFSWMTSGGTYREAAFERDLAALAFFYGNEGYIEARFGKPRVTLSQDRRYVDIVIDIVEGRQFNLGQVEFSGDLLFSREELRESFEMEEGDVFSTGVLQENILALTDKYGDEGYAFANVIPRTRMQEGEPIVNLLIDLEKGEKVYWGNIKVTGNTKTHDKVIRRELRFNEGELYSATKRKKSLERIMRLGYFGNDVNFLTSSPKGESDQLDLEIRVSEKPSGTLVVQAGYGSGAGASFGAQISQANLFGRGQQLSLNLQLSKQDQTFNLSFTDPKVFDTEWLLGGDLYLTKTDIGRVRTYNQEIFGGAIRVGREIVEDLNASGSYKLEKYKLTDAVSEDIFTDPVKDAESVISSVTTALAWDKRNNRIDPSGGHFVSASSEFAGLGGRVFQKFNFDARYYRKVWGSLVFRTKFEYGLLTNFMTDETVPDAERYVLGGVSSMRGYRQSTVGPTRAITITNDEGTTTSDYTIGGTNKLLYINELEMPLIPDANIRIAFFFDVGNSWDPNISSTGAALLANYGWGIRWYSPLGPLRFEWGYPLSTVPGKNNKDVEFHFIIAPTF